LPDTGAEVRRCSDGTGAGARVGTGRFLTPPGPCPITAPISLLIIITLNQVTKKRLIDISIRFEKKEEYDRIDESQKEERRKRQRCSGESRKKKEKKYSKKKRENKRIRLKIYVRRSEIKRYLIFSFSP
jgi:hypothetical protein